MPTKPCEHVPARNLFRHETSFRQLKRRTVKRDTLFHLLYSDNLFSFNIAA